MNKPITELERAFGKALNGPAGYPDFFRQLRAADLYSLVPYHPEMEGPGEIMSNQSFTFRLVSDKRGPGIPLFLSREPLVHPMPNSGSRPSTRPCRLLPT